MGFHEILLLKRATSQTTSHSSSNHVTYCMNYLLYESCYRYVVYEPPRQLISSFSLGLSFSSTPPSDETNGAPPMNKHEYQNASLLALCLCLGYFDPSTAIPTVTIELGAGKKSNVLKNQMYCPVCVFAVSDKC